MNPIARVAAVAVVCLVAVGGGLYLVRGQAPSPGSLGSASPPPASIEGTWETTFTRAEMLAAGLNDSAEDDGDNWGHFVLSIHGGSTVMVQLSEPRTGGSAAAYVVTGNHYKVTSSEAVFDWTFTVTDTTLTFGGDGPVTLRAKPWTRIGP
jgi:hypothetical protein